MKRLLYKNTRAYDCEVPTPSGGGLNILPGFGVEGDFFTQAYSIGVLRIATEAELPDNKIIMVKYTDEYLEKEKETKKEEPMLLMEQKPEEVKVVEKEETLSFPEKSFSSVDPLEDVPSTSMEETASKIEERVDGQRQTSVDMKTVQKMSHDELLDYAKQKYDLTLPSTFSKKEIIKLLKVRMT